MTPALSNTLSPALKTLKQYLQSQYQARLNRVVLFGSHARQQATDDSNVDILIVLHDPVDASSESPKQPRCGQPACPARVLAHRLRLHPRPGHTIAGQRHQEPPGGL
jgi:hypothetical protein